MPNQKEHEKNQKIVVVLITCLNLIYFVRIIILKQSRRHTNSERIRKE